jgi:hypothetical protein
MLYMALATLYKIPKECPEVEAVQRHVFVIDFQQAEPVRQCKNESLLKDHSSSSS